MLHTRQTFSFLIKKSLLSIIICLNIKYHHAYPYYPKCPSRYYLNQVDTTVLETHNGKVRGECYNVPINYPNGRVKSSGVFTWLSVPYAEPPVGSRRFLKPEPVKNWKNVRDGKNWPNKCLQVPNSAQEKLTSSPGYNITKELNLSDDCLYLNIFATADNYINNIVKKRLVKSSLLPIFVFIHGGSLTEGSTTEDRFDGSILAATNDVIVVTINYRVDAYGFMYLSGSKAVGNQGFLDQSLALKWVYNNAHKFGGDKAKITLGGQSAGGFSVGYHLIHEPNWPYFRNAIIQSGSPLLNNFPFITREEASNRTLAILSMLKCVDKTKNQNPNDIVNCAQKIDPVTLIMSARKYFLNILGNNLVSFAYHFTPFPLVQDGIIFKRSIKSYYENDKFKKCSILTGFTRSEAGSLIAESGLFGNTNEKLSSAFLDLTSFQGVIQKLYEYYPMYPTKPSASYLSELFKRNTVNNPANNYLFNAIQIITNQFFVCPTLKLADAYSKFNNVYLYEYNHFPSFPKFPTLFGVVHSYDLITSFGIPLAIKTPPLISKNIYSPVYHNYSSSEREYSLKHMKYFMNFVKFDNPNDSKERNGMKSWSSLKVASKFKFYNFDKNPKIAGAFFEMGQNNFKMSNNYTNIYCNIWYK